MIKRIFVTGALLSALAVFVACGGDDDGQQSILVGAAMSLLDVNAELANAFHAQHENIILEFTHASSGALQAQIEGGADIDVFMSAAMAQMNNLEGQGLIYGTPRNLVRNTVALVVPTGNTLGLAGFEDLILPGVVTIGVGDEATPFGNFAREVFDSYGILDELNAKSVLGSDVGMVVAWVETGQVDAGVVFGTNVVASDNLELVVVADAFRHSPSVNPVGIVANSDNMAAAQIFVDFLFSDTARAIFEEFGFAMYN